VHLARAIVDAKSAHVRKDAGYDGFVRHALTAENLNAEIDNPPKSLGADHFGSAGFEIAAFPLVQQWLYLPVEGAYGDRPDEPKPERDEPFELPKAACIGNDAAATALQSASSFCLAPSRPFSASPCASASAFIAPALAPLTPSKPRFSSSSRRSRTPQVNAPRAPPPCRARFRVRRLNGEARCELKPDSGGSGRRHRQAASNCRRLAGYAASSSCQLVPPRGTVTELGKGCRNDLGSNLHML
jgi:hypothetical protein